jgi:hypothetical protein
MCEQKEYQWHVPLSPNNKKDNIKKKDMDIKKKEQKRHEKGVIELGEVSEKGSFFSFFNLSGGLHGGAVAMAAEQAAILANRGT